LSVEDQIPHPVNLPERVMDMVGNHGFSFLKQPYSRTLQTTLQYKVIEFVCIDLKNKRLAITMSSPVRVGGGPLG
jgi:hypothetical protein